MFNVTLNRETIPFLGMWKELLIHNQIEYFFNPLIERSATHFFVTVFNIFMIQQQISIFF